MRFGDWSAKDIDVLNTFQLLTAKPVVYLVNLSKVPGGAPGHSVQGAAPRRQPAWLLQERQHADRFGAGSCIAVNESARPFL